MSPEERQASKRQVQSDAQSDKTEAKSKDFKVDPETVKAVRETVEQYEEALLELAKR